MENKTYAEKRKGTPVFSGVLNYFPDAMRALARCSQAGNDQHNPNSPLHWDRSKSGDELDALTRHLLEAGTVDTDGILHSTKVAWRALANLQKEIENMETEKIKTGAIKVGVRNLQGSTMSMASRDAELISRGYTIEKTPNGRIVNPPKN